MTDCHRYPARNAIENILLPEVSHLPRSQTIPGSQQVTVFKLSQEIAARSDRTITVKQKQEVLDNFTFLSMLTLQASGSGLMSRSGSPGC